jgi:hypothetical protein
VAETAAHRRLVRLYAAMAEHTEPECGACARPHSCCEERYCLLAIDFARDYWGVELRPGWHPTLPLMGPAGCTVPPHLRPICTLHTCAVNEHGCKPGDPAWTARYVELRDAIDAIQAELFPGAPV